MEQKIQLARAVGLPGAVMMGMGSIVGTGVFVSLGLAAGAAGPLMVLSLLFASILAICNGLSTAQLAASHPLSGGTYEYGYKYVNPWTGYLAGWLFVCAKSASAATAALGFGGYFIQLFGIKNGAPWQIGLLATAFVVFVAVLGIKRSNLMNTVIVSISLTSLVIYCLAVMGELSTEHFVPVFANYANQRSIGASFFEATALMFVAFTGYGRVATLGEEIKDPVKNIPRAIIVTLLLSAVIYIGVATASIGVVGAEFFYKETITGAAPLQAIAHALHQPFVATILSVGAMTAMLGVLLNLVLGLSRVIFAMGRKADLPTFFAKVDHRRHVPNYAILASGCIILSLILLKDIKAAWSFSAFTVLIYYAITNLAALKLPKENRLYPRILTWTGLAGCLSLGFWLEQKTMILGGTILLVGIAWRIFFRSLPKQICDG